MPISPETIAALIDIDQPAVAEILAVYWSDEVTRYYAITRFDQIVPHRSGLTLSPIEARLLGDEFHSFELSGDLTTEDISFKFDNIDGDIKQKFQTYGGGVDCELYYYWPDVGHLENAWFGQLGTPSNLDDEQLDVVATNGHMSKEILLPRRDGASHICPFTFGAYFSDMAMLNKNGCPYNEHLGGPIGVPGFTSCPRLSKADCNERLDTTDGKYFGGMDWRIDDVIIDLNHMTPGRTEGLGKKVKQPVRVIAGAKYVRDAPLIYFRRELNVSAPDQGFARGVWRIGEGPVEMIASIQINDKWIEPEHIQFRYGQRGQTQLPASLWANIPNMTWTAHFSAAFGRTNPGQITSQNFKALFACHGYNQVRVYETQAAGAGLVGEYFSDPEFLALVGSRIDLTINNPASVSSPMPGMPITGFSVRWTGQITFDHSEVYTIWFNHDDSGRVEIDGDEIINNTDLGNDSGTFTAVADTPYDITVELVQGVAPGAHPWAAVLSWQSASQSLQVVPGSAFTQGGTENDYLQSWTNNRVWWLLELCTHPRFGRSYNHSRMYIPSFRDTAEWSYRAVTFTHPGGEEYTHTRTLFDAVLDGRPTVDVITEICKTGRFLIPCQYNGQYHTRHLGAYTDEELENAREFTATGRNPSIIAENGKPVIQISEVDPKVLVNEVLVKFEDHTNFDEERTITVDDPEQKALAGKAMGVSSFADIPRRIDAHGVRRLEEAIKFGYAILWFGEFNRGGVKNNCRVTFQTPYKYCLGLKKHDPIKPPAEFIEGYGYWDNTGEEPVFYQFEYFSVLTMKKSGKNTVTITAQAYNKPAMEAFEVEPEDPPQLPDQFTPPEMVMNPPTEGVTLDAEYEAGVLTVTTT